MQLAITKGGVTVNVDIIKITERSTRDFKVIPLPFSGKNRTSDGSNQKTYIVDIGKTLREITVSGVLTEETSTTAASKKASLIQFIKSAGSMSLTWGSESISSAHIKHSELGEDDTVYIRKSGVATSDTIGYSAEFVFVEGVDKVVTS